MKATSLLAQQHRSVEGLFEQLKTEGANRADLLRELANQLAAHMAIEQMLFYPAVRDVDPGLVDASYEEHSMAELALKRLLHVDPDHGTFDSKLSVLEDLIEAHVDEEEQELFPAVERALGDEQLEELGQKLESAFESAEGDGFEQLLPETFARTSADVALESMSEPVQGRARRPSRPSAT